MTLLTITILVLTFFCYSSLSSKEFGKLARISIWDIETFTVHHQKTIHMIPTKNIRSHETIGGTSTLYYGQYERYLPRLEMTQIAVLDRNGEWKIIKRKSFVNRQWTKEGSWYLHLHQVDQYKDYIFWTLISSNGLKYMQQVMLLRNPRIVPDGDIKFPKISFKFKVDFILTQEDLNPNSSTWREVLIECQQKLNSQYHRNEELVQKIKYLEDQELSLTQSSNLQKQNISELEKLHYHAKTEQTRLINELSKQQCNRNLSMQFNSINTTLNTLKNEHNELNESVVLEYKLSESMQFQLPSRAVENKHLWTIGHIISIVITCIATAIIIVLLFCLMNYYKKKKEFSKFAQIRKITKKINNTGIPVVLDKTKSIHKVKLHQMEKCIANKSHQKSLWNHENLKQTVLNAKAVQNVIMDDIIDDMENEGNSPQNLDTQSILYEGNDNHTTLQQWDQKEEI